MGPFRGLRTKRPRHADLRTEKDRASWILFGKIRMERDRARWIGWFCHLAGCWGCVNIVKNIRSNSETAADIRSDLGTAPAGRTTRRMDFNPETLSRHTEHHKSVFLDYWSGVIDNLFKELFWGRDCTSDNLYSIPKTYERESQEQSQSPTWRKNHNKKLPIKSHQTRR